MSQVTSPSPPETFISFPIATTGGFLVVPSQSATEPLRVNGSAGGDLIFLNFLAEEQFAQEIQDTARTVFFGITPPENPDALAAFNNTLAVTQVAIDSAPADVPNAMANAITELDNTIQVFQANGLDTTELITVRSQLANTLGGQADGGQGTDTIAAGRGDDCVFGNSGADILFGNQGRDTIFGGEGNDSIYGGKDNDVVVGGLGQDFASGDKGDDTVFGGQDADTVLGASGDDVIFGGQDNDIVMGGEGNDFAFGNKGDDSVYGDSGDDSVYGGQGEDTVFGGSGNDVLFGDKGNDLMSGGEGEDTFRLEFFGDAPTPVSLGNRVLGLDTITDFNPAEDVISLDIRLFPALDDTLRASFSQLGTFSDLSAQEAAIVYDPGQGLVYYNPTTAPGDEVDILKLETAPDNLTDNNLSSF